MFCVMNLYLINYFTLPQSLKNFIRLFIDTKTIWKLTSRSHLLRNAYINRWDRIDFQQAFGLIRAGTHRWARCGRADRDIVTGVVVLTVTSAQHAWPWHVVICRVVIDASLFFTWSRMHESKVSNLHLFLSHDNT